MTTRDDQHDSNNNNNKHTNLSIQPVSMYTDKKCLEARRELELLLTTTRNMNDRDLRDNLKRVRILVYQGALMSNDTHDTTIQSLRCRVWKTMLHIIRTSSTEYTKHVTRGPSEYHDKIVNDVFRTCVGDTVFWSKVDGDTCVRVLNAFVWKCCDHPPSRLLNLNFTYVQGMNVLMAPFLYTMSELDTFYCVYGVMVGVCPMYVQRALEGVHCGVKLYEKCLRELDPELSQYLVSHGAPATLYAFPSIMTLSACTPPLSELVMLWDMYLSFGVHLNIICVVVQVMLIRDKLMNTTNPMKLLRTMPPLNAKQILDMTWTCIPKLSDELYDTVARHTFDPYTCDVMLQEDVGDD